MCRRSQAEHSIKLPEPAARPPWYVHVVGILENLRSEGLGSTRLFSKIYWLDFRTIVVCSEQTVLRPRRDELPTLTNGGDARAPGAGSYELRCRERSRRTTANSALTSRLDGPAGPGY